MASNIARNTPALESHQLRRIQLSRSRLHRRPEVAFTVANAIACAEEMARRGYEIDSFAPRLSFFFSTHSDFFEEIAKYRAARRLWAKVMKGRFGARNPRSLILRFHVQTAGVSLTAQQPLNNITGWRTKPSRQCSAERSQSTRTPMTRPSASPLNFPRSRPCGHSRSSNKRPVSRRQ